MDSASDKQKAPADVPSGDARSPPSDTDERPVRQQLKETSIDSSSMAASRDPNVAASAPEPGSGRKRSFEEARSDNDDALENGDGPRKRSRESTPEDAKKDSAAAPASDNVSEPNHPKDPVPTPKDPVHATPKDLATDESSHGTLDSPDVEVIAIPDSEPEDIIAHPGITEVIEISSESESESELEIVSVPDVNEVITISDSESDSEEEAQTPKPTHIQDGGFDSAELKSPKSSVSRESTLESEIPAVQIENPGRPPSEASLSDYSSCGWSIHKEPIGSFEWEGLSKRDVSEAPTEPSLRPPSEPTYGGWTPVATHIQDGGFDAELESEIPGAQIQNRCYFLPGATYNDWSIDQETQCLDEREDSPEPLSEPEPFARAHSERSSSGWSSDQETLYFVENDNTNTYPQDPKKIDTAHANNADDAKGLTKKRSLEQLQEEDLKETKETENKRHRDNSQERETQTANAFAQSAFANTAASSPFASLGGAASTSTADDRLASTSAFASSALSSFAGSDNSPFGSLGSSKPSVFKSGSGISGFGSSSTSGFGALKSGFAGVSGGFGAAAAKSGGLTNFASPNAPATLGGETKASKPLGADESDDEGSDGSDGEEYTAFEADKTDERFYEQTIETGEEEEENLFTCKGKLFHFSNGEWKERGVGTFKINTRTSDTGKQHGRMIMRADGALRVMLNSPVFKGMTYGDAKNEEPTSKQIFLASNEEGRTVPLLLRVGNEALAKDLYNVLRDLLDGE